MKYIIFVLFAFISYSTYADDVCGNGLCDDTVWVVDLKNHPGQKIALKLSHAKVVRISHNRYRLANLKNKPDGWNPTIVIDGIVSKKNSAGQICYRTSMDTIKVIISEMFQEEQIQEGKLKMTIKYKPVNYSLPVLKPLSFCK